MGKLFRLTSAECKTNESRMESKLEAKIKTILLIALISQLAYAPTKKTISCTFYEQTSESPKCKGNFKNLRFIFHVLISFLSIIFVIVVMNTLSFFHKLSQIQCNIYRMIITVNYFCKLSPKFWYAVDMWLVV